MATKIKTNQSMKERRTHFVDYHDDIPDGVTLNSVTATHTPPSGTPETPTVVMSLNPVIQITIGPLSVVGNHLLSVLAAYSNGDKSEVLIDIAVSF